MRILITNDDGLSASQLLPLIRWCQKLGEVTAVVPKVEQSGKSHGIELHKSFEARLVELAPDVTVWSVDSTPADCVRFAILGQHMEFDLAISGINRGLNMGADMMYSGTIGAAGEAVNLGVQAIALSTSPENYDRAVESLDRVFAYIRENDLLAKNDLYNVNIPADPIGIRITRQGGPYYSDDFEPMENDHFHPRGKSVWKDQGNMELDTDATFAVYITITPLTIGKTDMTVFNALSNLNP